MTEVGIELLGQLKKAKKLSIQGNQTLKCSQSAVGFFGVPDGAIKKMTVRGTTVRSEVCNS